MIEARQDVRWTRKAGELCCYLTEEWTNATVARPIKRHPHPHLTEQGSASLCEVQSQVNGLPNPLLRHDCERTQDRPAVKTPRSC